MADTWTAKVEFVPNSYGTVTWRDWSWTVAGEPPIPAGDVATRLDDLVERQLEGTSGWMPIDMNEILTKAAEAVFFDVTDIKADFEEDSISEGLVI